MDDRKHLELLLEQAERAEKVPDLPVAGIPKQWVPSWLRYAIKLWLLPFIHLDLLAQALAKKLVRPPFQQIGTCKKRGNCCHYILIPQSKGVFGKIFYFWHTQINGFYLRESTLFELETKKMHVMGCRYLKQNGSCSQHFLRPTLCRKWPVIEHFGSPRVLRGCGFKAIPRKGAPNQASLLQILEEREARGPGESSDPFA